MAARTLIPRRVASSFLLSAIAFLCLGCSLLGFVEDRLDPPKPGPHGITFRYKAPAAREVNLAGEFNNWLGTAAGNRLDPKIDPMKDLDGDGIWEITLPLPPGRYQYKYVIDQVDWQADPSNPESTDDGYGGKNSILVVPSQLPYAYDEAYLSYSLNTSSRVSRSYDYTFTLEGYEDAKSVYVTGDWSNWDPSASALTLGGNGVWSTTIKLPEGEHLYKFVVDGKWMADPGNSESRDDGYGGKNSVANVRPK
ncbi:MAG TPA: hypothetical protein VKA63_01270 [Candidatus Krumholzibacteria bacterium]|nr:hypothetical protein [Candidatus Krumholzibacteria bacterium]